jgi:hypothetical protein
MMGRAMMLVAKAKIVTAENCIFTWVQMGFVDVVNISLGG